VDEVFMPDVIGFIGLGIMGAPMAANLVKAGFDVAGHTRSRGGLDRLAAAGGRPVAGLAEAVADADVVITVLPDSPDVEQVVLGRDGVLAHARPGTLLIDMSTIRPQTARTVAAAAADRGLRPLDAPVSGGEQGAVEGTLSIMVGGAEADFSAAQPVLEALGSTIVHVGPAGAGQTVKAANQLVVAGTIQLVAEAIVLLEASGVDPAAGLKVLAGGLAGSTVLERKAASMLAREFRPGFRVDLHHKDLGIMLDAAREAGAVVPVGALVAQLMAALRAQGDGSSDHTALLRLAERMAGRGSASLSPPASLGSAQAASLGPAVRAEGRVDG
jgi:2-hydroxy-3-oxopropionate reductase